MVLLRLGTLETGWYLAGAGLGLLVGGQTRLEDLEIGAKFAAEKAFVLLSGQKLGGLAWIGGSCVRAGKERMVE